MKRLIWIIVFAVLAWAMSMLGCLARPIDREHRDFCRHNPKDSSCQKGEK